MIKGHRLIGGRRIHPARVPCRWLRGSCNVLLGERNLRPQPHPHSAPHGRRRSRLRVEKPGFTVSEETRPDPELGVGPDPFVPLVAAGEAVKLAVAVAGRGVEDAPVKEQV